MATITGLDAGTTYWCAVRAENLEGESVYTGAIMATTASGVPVRNNTKDISLGNGSWSGACSDGDTLWFGLRTGSSTISLAAWDAQTRGRDSDEDYSLSGPSFYASEISSVAHFTDGFYYIYLRNNSRRLALDIDGADEQNVYSSSSSNRMRSVISKGDYVYRVDTTDGIFVAYLATDGTATPSENISIAAPTGTWGADYGAGFFWIGSGLSIKAYNGDTYEEDTSKEIDVTGEAVSSSLVSGITVANNTLWILDRNARTAKAWDL